MRKTEREHRTGHATPKERFNVVASRGEWPMPEPADEADDPMELGRLAGLEWMPVGQSDDVADHLTPGTLLGGHREGRWAARGDEAEQDAPQPRRRKVRRRSS